jgi:hypothetical protein
MDPVSVLLSTHVAATVSINEPKNPKIASRTITRVRRFVLVLDRERCTGRTCVPISWMARCCIPVSCVLMSCILIRSYSLQDLAAKLEVLLRKSATCPQFFWSFTKRNANGSAFGSCRSIYCGTSIIVPHFSGKNTLKCDITCPRQGPTYVLDKSALPVPQTGSYSFASLVAIARRTVEAESVTLPGRTTAQTGGSGRW